MSPKEAAVRLEKFAGISPTFGGPSKAHCYDFEYEVNVDHEDESDFKLSCAFVVQWENWYFVLTEHTGYFLFCADDVKISQLEGYIREDGEFVQRDIKIPLVDEFKGNGDLYDKV